VPSHVALFHQAMHAWARGHDDILTAPGSLQDAFSKITEQIFPSFSRKIAATVLESVPSITVYSASATPSKEPRVCTAPLLLTPPQLAFTIHA
jgi:hypothetical protein